MKQIPSIRVTKVTGEVVDFSLSKLRKSLVHSGAKEKTIDKITSYILQNVYDGITSGEIYKMAYEQLRDIRAVFASKYKLKKAIYELGPSGFPFERLVAIIFNKMGYETKVGKIIQGKCVSHEIDVLLFKKNVFSMVECKFHSSDQYICNIKVPLYINSRFQDVIKYWNEKNPLKNVWIVTNTRFSQDAINYANCNGINLLSWNYPKDKGLKEMINRFDLYPLTTLTLLSEGEKDELLNQGIVLCSELYQIHSLMNKIGVSKVRKQKIMEEIEDLCHKNIRIKI